MGRVTQFVKLPAKAPPSADEFNRLQDRLVEALRVLRQSPQALLDARGSIVAATAAGAPAEHLVGSDTQVLTADSSAATGLSWTSGSPFANILDYGAVAGGLQDAAAAFTAAWAVSPVALVPAGTFLISGLTVPAGKSILGLGAAKSVLTYAGATDAIVLDGCQFSTVSGIKVITTNASATVCGIHLKNTSAGSQWNYVTDCELVQNNATGRIAGQVGILLEDNSAAVHSQFWNTIRGNKLLNWETCIGALQTGAGADGVNQNTYENNMCAAFITGLSLGARCHDNKVDGLSCTHSSGSAFTDTALVIGDGVGASDNNICTGIIADLGANGRAFFIQAGCLNTFMVANNESSQIDVDSGTNSTIFLTKNIGGATQRVRLPSLQVSGVASVSGNLSTGSALQFAKFRTVADANVTLTTADYYTGYSTLTATRTVFLPSASAGSGIEYWLQDESGNAAAGVKLILSANTAGQSVNGVANPGTIDAVTTPFGSVRIKSNGANWFFK